MNEIHEFACIAWKSIGTAISADPLGLLHSMATLSVNTCPTILSDEQSRHQQNITKYTLTLSFYKGFVHGYKRIEHTNIR